MSSVITVISDLLLCIGGFFVIVSVIGLHRFPDFFTRLHAAGITDTAACLFILVGLMLQTGFNLITIKLLLILFFIFFTSPLSSYALARGALQKGLQPEEKS